MPRLGSGVRFASPAPSFSMKTGIYTTHFVRTRTLVEIPWETTPGWVLPTLNPRIYKSSGASSTETHHGVQPSWASASTCFKPHPAFGWNATLDQLCGVVPAPTAAPVPPPTAAPTAAPGAQPIGSVTRHPIAAPTPAPVNPPCTARAAGSARQVPSRV